MIHAMFKQLSITVTGQGDTHLAQIAHGAAVLREMLGKDVVIVAEFQGKKIGVTPGMSQQQIVQAYAPPKPAEPA